MTLTEFIQMVNYKATGKPTSPSSGSKKYNQILLAGKTFTEIWQNEPGTDWSSLYDFRNSGTITANDTFALDDEIRKVSQQEGDYIRILHTDGESTTEYKLVPANRLHEYRFDYAVAVAGRNLMFSKAFTSTDRQFGGTIVVPSYGYAEFPVSAGDDIQVDDPYWLVNVCAGEFVRNDITRKAEYPNLLGEASVMMEKMKENNGGGVDEAYRPNFFATNEVY